MKALSVSVVLVACLFLLVSFSSGQSNPAKQERLVFENEFVRAYEVTVKPGEKPPAHTSNERLIYSLTDYTLKYNWEGKTSTEKRKAGDVHYHPAGTHCEEGAGTTTARFILVERLAKPLPPHEGTGVDMARANPHNTKVLFDRDLAKVFEVTVYPKDAVSMHFGLDRLIYAATTAEMEVTTPDGKKTREVQKKGTYHWHAAGLHAVENVGSGQFRFVVFGFKR
jgi:hypothetical protein